MPLVRFTDDQLDLVFRLARPLSSGCREEFLRLLALEFRDRLVGLAPDQQALLIARDHFEPAGFGPSSEPVR